jgi:DNA recombination protein RmuC
MTPLETALLAGLVAALIAACGIAAFMNARTRHLRAECDRLRNELAGAEQQIRDQHQTAEERLRARTEAETRLTAVQENLTTVSRQRDAAFADFTQEAKAREAAEKRAALAEQARAETEARMADWEAVKVQALEAAKAAMLATTQQVSSKLLEDHKREAEAQKKDSEERVKKTTEALQANFGKLAESVTSLGTQMQQTAGQTEQILRALSNPAGAGYYAEIGLENMLREFGLELGRDFIMQHTIEGQEDGSRLRPDAVVFLPGDTVLTVDSKASKYLLEAANAEGTEREQEAYTNLAKTMNAHLKALSSKDYASAIQATYRKAGRGDRVTYAINIMYLPTEGGIERLSRADAQFQKKAVAENIVIAGPTGLMSNIGFARCRIDLGRQADNQEKIILAARQLIEAVTTVVGYVAGVGKGIKAAADSHAKLVSSVNSRLLPRQRTLANLGVRQAKQKELPGNVPLIQVFSQEETDVIEGESEEVATLVEATKLTVVRD